MRCFLLSTNVLIKTFFSLLNVFFSRLTPTSVQLCLVRIMRHCTFPFSLTSLSSFTYSFPSFSTFFHLSPYLLPLLHFFRVYFSLRFVFSSLFYTRLLPPCFIVNYYFNSLLLFTFFLSSHFYFSLILSFTARSHLLGFLTFSCFSYFFSSFLVSVLSSQIAYIVNVHIFPTALCFVFLLHYSFFPF